MSHSGGSSPSSKDSEESYSDDSDHSTPKKLKPPKPGGNLEGLHSKTDESRIEIETSLNASVAFPIRKSYEATPKAQGLEIKRLQAENLELRNQLKSLNSRINEVLEKPIKHKRPQSHEQVRARGEQLKTAEKQLKTYQLEYQKVKARYTKAVEYEYIDTLMKEVEFKQLRIRDLDSKLKLNAVGKRGREKVMDKLLVQGDAPELVKKINELSAELSLLTSKTEEAHAEAARKQKVLESLKESEANLLKKAAKLQTQVPSEPISEVPDVETQKRFSQNSEMAKQLEIIQHSILSQERNYKRKEGLLLKEHETVLVALAEAKNGLHEKIELLTQVGAELKEITSSASSLAELNTESKPKPPQAKSRSRNLSNLRNRSFGELPESELPRVSKPRAKSNLKNSESGKLDPANRSRTNLHGEGDTSRGNSASNLPPLPRKRLAKVTKSSSSQVQLENIEPNENPDLSALTYDKQMKLEAREDSVEGRAPDRHGEAGEPWH
mmetsp:Transcript_7406/g.13812  ORF Transcript_7406/g.13812 Transcript_7406/m.13812 type:complete len:496 (+) Transcript_7406:236-1723(+)